MLYAFLCCHDEAVANSWTKEENAARRLFPFFRRKGRALDAARPRQRGPDRFRPGDRARSYAGGSRSYPPASRPADQGEPACMTTKKRAEKLLRQMAERRSAHRPWFKR